jgi:hypothetical protein
VADGDEAGQEDGIGPAQRSRSPVEFLWWKRCVAKDVNIEHGMRRRRRSVDDLGAGQKKKEKKKKRMREDRREDGQPEPRKEGECVSGYGRVEEKADVS